MGLREYQAEFVRRFRASVRAGNRRILAVSPTGSGKTVMGSTLSAAHIAKSPDHRVAFIVHRRELIKQSAAALARQGLDVGHLGMNASAPVQVESVQAILAKGTAPPGTFVILDECHHFAEAAEAWSAIPKVYEKAIVLGLTATPERGDGAPLGDVFQDIIPVAQISELIAQGHLAPCDAEDHLVPVGATDKALALSPLDAWRRYVPGVATVVFAPSVRACEAFAREFTEAGVAAAVVTGTTPKDERDRTLASFDAGRLQVLVNVMVLTEGWDSPRAKACIMARRFGSAGLYIQAGGRVLRPFEGQRAKIIDLTGSNIATHGPLFVDREYSLEGNAISVRNGPAGPTFCKLHANPSPCDLCRALGIFQPSMPEVAGVDLVPWEEKVARNLKRDATADKRVAYLAQMIRLTREKGHKPGYAAVRFHKRYGMYPTREMTQMAEDMIRGEYAIGERDGA